MAHIQWGYMDGFSGKLGPAVGSTWKGMPVVRARPRKNRSRKFSPKQELQQAKFQLMSGFIKSLGELPSRTFNDEKGKTGYNSALSYNILNAIGGTYPDLFIDYRSVLIARGQLPGVNSVAGTVEGDVLTFTWPVTGLLGNAKTTDQVIIVAYHPVSRTSKYMIADATRGDGKATMRIPGLVGEEFETWMALLSEDAKHVSSSHYAGRLTLAA